MRRRQSHPNRPRRGYRFIGRLETEDTGAPAAAPSLPKPGPADSHSQAEGMSPEEAGAASAVLAAEPAAALWSSRHRTLLVALAVVVLAAAAVAAWLGWRKRTAVPAAAPRIMLAALAQAYGLAGQSEKAQELLKEMVARSKTSYVSPFDMAQVHIGLGDKDQAFAWLQKASQEHCPALVYLRLHPWADGLRSDPRFQDLLGRLRLPG